MKVLVVSQYFWPESFIINDLVKNLSAQGHVVKVLTGKPNYPDGVVFDGYSASGYQEENYESSVSVCRAPLRPRGSSGAKNLLLNYLSFIVNGVKFYPGAVKGEQFDAIFVFAPSPITSVIPAIYLKWKLKSHLAVWVQDLWPESLSATGFITNKAALRVVGWMVKGIYAFVDTLLVQSRAFREPVTRYADAGKVVYYPNSYPDVAPSTEEPRIPAPLLAELDNHFCLVFAGNLGTAQSVETLVEVTEKLRHLSGLRIVLVGSGSMSSWIESQKQSRGLDNLVLAGRFPVTEMPHFFSRAAGLLVTLKQDEAFSYTIPSKVQAYLAAGRPIIAALDGEGARVIQEARAGLTCPAQDADGMANSIEQLFHMSSDERESLGRSGRAYYLEHFEMERQSQRLVEILSSRINELKGRSK
ncbi:MAG: glycosyltransferase family 4 protein [Pseudomonas sp.]|uniref:glycosyltransferase family 4 protein n=1 Tax=Pseudomonas TaxID=286 RepID=UPI001C83A8D6|nr:MULTISPECIES: glycosyltransferase family 4 protein [Pseudomonas]MDO9327509.1 glycosyltransferase family 4 protein [Pseudomonas sp.]QZA99811.1 glycosyltransferase family 4 protein [Pseudomonas mandelii]